VEHASVELKNSNLGLTIIVLASLHVAGLAKQAVYQSMLWWISAQCYSPGMKLQLQRQLMEFHNDLADVVQFRLSKFDLAVSSALALVLVRLVLPHLIFLCWPIFVGVLHMSCFNGLVAFLNFLACRHGLLQVPCCEEGSPDHSPSHEGCHGG